MLSGCFTAATEAGVSLAEERSIGTSIDDATIYADINRMYIAENDSYLFAGTTVNVRNRRVMLTGNIKDEARARKAVELAWKAKSVSEVINELTINPNVPLSSEANDALIKKNLEGRLLITKNVWVINYSIDVVNGTAYLLGRTHDQAEMERALNVARTTKGVKRVTNYLQNRPPEEPAPSYDRQPAQVITPNRNAPSYTSSPYSSPPAAQSTPYYSAPPAEGTYAAPEPISSAPLPPTH
jgi:osmotically-inducible protein OsmY